MDNPRQFSSLDYADADMYGALVERPSPGVPLEKPRPVTATNRENATERATEKRLWQEETARNAEYFRQQKQQEIAREAEILRREAAQRQAIANRISGNAPADPEVATPRRESPLAQQQRSTPERQPLPSRGSPPPTISGTAARPSALVEPTALPAPAALKEAIANTLGGAASALPRSVPTSAGRLLIPGVSAGLSLGSRLVAGQSVTQAVVGTAGVFAGSTAGTLIGTAVGGPVGGMIGGMIGGYVGGYIADSFFRNQLPSTVPDAPIYTPNYQTFVGGQDPSRQYYVYWERRSSIGTVVQYQSAPLIGAITAFTVTATTDNRWKVDIYYNSGNSVGSTTVGSTSDQRAPYVTAVSRTDGSPEIYPDTRPSTAQPPDNRPYYLSENPLNSDATIPSGTPAAGRNKGKTREIAPSLPSNNVPNGGGAFPGHGGLAPSFLPNPTQTPQPLPGLMPAQQNQRQPLPFAEPEDMPQARPVRFGLQITPSTGGVVEPSYADVTPATITPTTVTPATITPSEGNDSQGNPISGVPYVSPVSTNSTGVPTSIPFPVRLEPIPDALSPTPKANSAPKVESPTETIARKQAEDNEATKKAIEDQVGRLTAIATAIAALTPAIQGIPNAIANSPNVRAANRDDVQGAVCEISQPTGCLGAPIKQAEDAAKANGNKLDQLNAALGAGNAGANAALLAGQETILQRLGDQLPGGIGGKLSRFADWMHLDRLLNLMTFAATVHNAAMLSNNLAQTLFSAIGNVLSAIGLKKEDGSAFDIGSVISSGIESLIKGMIGE
ncbi:MAG: hypothetical protein RMY16_13255 [Nostoc sp. DedQUE12b]|uniref:hypothetical protein n=1 Tax=Nostoc sp. DedQUE12b TaxID=3075398 RepID=UPI002AD3A270|nr:hypothetical protein [Nostoc sp. DedQUE12b]MDZ8086506.1 hypothetical protein [Nostoc sp. DedQUE12b]